MYMYMYVSTVLNALNLTRLSGNTSYIVRFSRDQLLNDYICLTSQYMYVV